MKLSKKLKYIKDIIFQISNSQSILKDRILSDMENLINRYNDNLLKMKKIKELKKELRKENKFIKKELKKIKKELLLSLKTKDNSLESLKHNINLMLKVQKNKDIL